MLHGKMHHEQLRILCILLFVDGEFYRCLLGLGWLIYSVNFFISLLIFCLNFSIHYQDYIIDVSTNYCYMSSMLVFCIMNFDALQLGAHILRIVIFSWPLFDYEMSGFFFFNNKFHLEL